MNFLKQNLFKKSNLARFIVSAIIGVAIFVFDLLNVSGFSSLTSYADAGLITAFFEVLLAGLAWCANEGAFNIFGFYPTRKKIGNRKENYTEFCERRAEERKSTKFAFLVYISIAIIFLGISGIFALLSFIF